MVGPGSTVLERLLRVEVFIKVPGNVSLVETESPALWD